MAIFRGYGTFFSELLDYNYSYRYWLNPLTYFIGKQHKKKKSVVFGQNLGQIMSHIVKKVEKQALSTVFLFIFYMEISFKGKGSGCTNTWVEI